MINKITIEKLEIDLTGHDLWDMLKSLEDGGVDLKGFRVVSFHEGRQRLIVQRVRDEKVEKSQLLFKENATTPPSPVKPYVPTFTPRIGDAQW